MRKHLLFLSVAAAVGGCAKPEIIPAPPEAYVNLAGARASYRDWSRVADICAQCGTQAQGDVDSMTALLEGWLKATEAGADAAARSTAMEGGLKQLPVALKLDEALAARLKGQPCAPASLAKLETLTASARTRMDGWKDEQAAQAKKTAALAAWKASLADAAKVAKEKRCPPQGPAWVKGKYEPVAYFASTDEAGRTEWLFCDGARLAADKGQPKVFAEKATTPPSGKPPVVKGKAGLLDGILWMDAAAKFPAADVSVAP